MPALRLKTKLVFAITGMVLAIVATLSTVYVSQVVKLRLQETLDDGNFIAQGLRNGVAKGVIERPVEDNVRKETGRSHGRRRFATK